MNDVYPSGGVPPPPYDPAQQGWTPIEPMKRKTRFRWIVATVAAGLLVAAAVWASLAWVMGASTVSAETAERVCRTAFEDEAKLRAAEAEKAGEESPIYASTTNIVVEDQYSTAAGYVVNGRLHYTINSPLIAPIAGSVGVTCTVTGTDDDPQASVRNRS